MNYAGLKLVTAPAAEFVLLTDVKDHLRIDGGSDDAYLSRLIAMARSICESIMRRAFLQQTWQLSLQNWPGRDYQNWPVSFSNDLQSYYRYNHIKLPMAAPLQSVTSVDYKNSDGTQLTMPQGNVLGGYNVDANYEPGRIVLPFSGIWPTDILLPGAAIQIQYVCGFADAEAFESGAEYYAPAVQAVLELCAYTYENRVPPSEMRRASVSAGIMMVVDEMLTPYRLFV